MLRQGSVIKLRVDKIDIYEKHHREAWPEVLEALRDANFQNYSIYRWGDVLFSYREYVGVDYAADMAVLDAHPPTQEWVALMQTLQIGLNPDRGQEWTELPEIFHLP